MQLLLKAVIVAIITLCITLPLLLIGGVVHERKNYRVQAVESIAASVGGPQTFAGPVLVLPYSEAIEKREPDANGVAHVSTVEREGREVVFAKNMVLGGTLPTDERSRGIHRVRIYTWNGQVDAHFDHILPDSPPGSTRKYGQPWLAWQFSDPRGLQGTPHIRLNQVPVAAEAGAGFRNGPGMHVRLAEPRPGQHLAFDTHLDLQLRGTQTFSVLPLADDNRIDLASEWNAPKFVGTSPDRQALPKGFAAHWQVSALASQARAGFSPDEGHNDVVSPASALPEDATTENDVPGRISIGFAAPVNTYTTIARSIKYGMLFVVVTFAGFFLFEILRRVPIHPIQYGLVGLALAIFFLLLVSLSEHMEFGAAYLAAAAACIGLITYYLAAVLRGWRPALGFCALLTTLYGVLYGLLISEDLSLVMGSGLLFVLLAAIMGLTRRVDWYGVAPMRGWRSGLRQPVASPEVELPTGGEA